MQAIPRRELVCLVHAVPDAVVGRFGPCRDQDRGNLLDILCPRRLHVPLGVELPPVAGPTRASNGVLKFAPARQVEVGGHAEMHVAVLLGEPDVGGKNPAELVQRQVSFLVHLPRHGDKNIHWSEGPRHRGPGKHRVHSGPLGIVLIFVVVVVVSEQRPASGSPVLFRLLLEELETAAPLA